MKTRSNYESISFEVESNLTKPETDYDKTRVEDIFRSLFRRAKNNTTNGEYFSNRNEFLEILHYEFNTEETEFFNQRKNSLVKGLIEAYRNHFPITISPDMIWILFLQGYSRFMEKYSELVRSQYVTFEDKKKLSVNRFGIFPEEADKETWRGIINEFTDKIKENMGEKIMYNLQSNFSTTDHVCLTTSQVSIMSAMKEYFIYSVGMGGCGISSITLEGSLDDWKQIKSKLEFLSQKKFALLWWIKHLIPIIDKIIMTKDYYTKHNKINKEIKDFWKDMIRIKFGEEYDPNYINGWIIKFIPNITGRKPELYDELKEDDVPDQIISCPMELIVLNLDGTKTEYKCNLASGFYGMTQDKDTFNVKPVIGYAIVVEEKNTTKMSNEDKKKIIDEYFC